MARFRFVGSKGIKRGDKRTFRVTCSYPEDVPASGISAGDPYPLDGKTIWFTGKRSIADPDERAIVRRRTGDGSIEITSGEDPNINNVALVTVPGEETVDLKRPVTLECDVQVLGEAEGEGPWTVAEGQIEVTEDVTRETS